MTIVDPQLVTSLIDTVQDRLEAEATRRSTAGAVPLHAKQQQEAFALAVLRRELQRLDERRLADGVVRLSADEESELTERVLAIAVGLGPIDLLMSDPTVEEVQATRHDMVFVVRADGRPHRVPDVMWPTEKELSAWVAHQARTAGRTERQFNAQSPMLVMRIGDGLRLAATRDVSQNVSFCLRRNTISRGSGLSALVERRMFPPVIARFLHACMRSTEMRLVVAGATAAGKTTLTRACLDELGPDARVVVIEDTAEIDLFDVHDHPNVESWEERLPNNEGEGGVGQGMLVKHALRYRPDWLVCGEVRDSDAAVPMLKAMTHGQSSLTTVHAHSAIAALDKLALYLGTGEDRLPIAVAHHQLAQAVDFVVHVERGDAGSQRYVSEIVEVAGYSGERATTNTIYSATAEGGHTMQRLTRDHLQRLVAVGFDPNELGGGWR